MVFFCITHFEVKVFILAKLFPGKKGAYECRDA